MGPDMRQPHNNLFDSQNFNIINNKETVWENNDKSSVIFAKWRRC